VRHHIFEIPDDQASLLVPAIDAGSFPWAKLVPGIQAQVGRDYIPTRLSDLSRYGARAAGEHSHDHAHDHDKVHILEARGRVLGLFWTDYRIEVDASLAILVDGRLPELLAEVLWSEAAHAIDQAMLTDAQRAEIVAALHPEGPDEHTWWERPGEDYGAAYNRLIGETMMQVVVEAYTPLKATINLHHEVTPHVIDVARRILTPESVEPAAPTAAPFFGLRRSKVVHDNHSDIARDIEWDSLAEAIAAGRRPCRVCRPKGA
jgi:hypothetical protein